MLRDASSQEHAEPSVRGPARAPVDGVTSPAPPLDRPSSEAPSSNPPPLTPDSGSRRPPLSPPRSIGARGPGDLAHALEPALLEACGGRLVDVHWFSSDWQQGGSATAQARWRDTPNDPSSERGAIVKLPVGPVELRWNEHLSEHPDSPVPATLASGCELGGYDLGWLVIEQADGSAVSADPCPEGIRALLEAVARFHALAQEHAEPAHAPKPPDWGELIDQSREVAREGRLGDAQRWNEALKHAQKLLPDLRRRWLIRPINAWCHGDVHPGNGLIGPDGTCRLIDLGMVHAGHWIEDAVMLERLFWGHMDRLDGLKPVSVLSKARRQLGLDNGPRANAIADVRRALIAACVPSRLQRDSNPEYVRYSLALLERLLAKLSA